MTRLSEAQIAQFRTEGFLVLPDAFASSKVARLSEEGGMVAPTGAVGTVLLFDCNPVHASPGNISPWYRTIAYVSACRVDNHVRRFRRPDWIAHRDFTPIECLIGLAAAD